MDALKRAARAALASAGELSSEGVVERVSLEVDVDGRPELVSASLRAGELALTCSCAQTQCLHRERALVFIAGGDVDVLDTPGRVPEAGSSPDVRVVDQSDRATRSDVTSLPDTLEDVVTAVVRRGLDTDASASVDESLERLVQAAPKPLPLGVQRWIGRLRMSLGRRDVDATARVLEGAGRLVDDLRATDPDEGARTRMLSWLGAFSGDSRGVDRIHDRVFVEVAREWLNGLERGGLERRYLVDVADGLVYREERARSARTASLGPCPRTVQVGLAEVERGAGPRRVRLLQYATSPSVDQGIWDQLGSWATRNFTALVEDYRAVVQAYPGLAEPFAIISPDEVLLDGGVRIVDDGGRPLPLVAVGDDPTPGQLMGVLSADVPTWLAGRLLDERGALMFKPLSAGTLAQGQTRFQRY